MNQVNHTLRYQEWEDFLQTDQNKSTSLPLNMFFLFLISREADIRRNSYLWSKSLSRFQIDLHIDRKNHWWEWWHYSYVGYNPVVFLNPWSIWRSKVNKFSQIDQRKQFVDKHDENGGSSRSCCLRNANDVVVDDRRMKWDDGEKSLTCWKSIEILEFGVCRVGWFSSFSCGLWLQAQASNSRLSSEVAI